MSDVGGVLPKKDYWVEDLQRKVFEECAAQKSPELVNVFSANKEKDLGDVPVSVIIDYINRNFAQIPYFRSQRIEFLEELENFLHRVQRNGHVNWYEFRNSSERWFLKLMNLLLQDGNNNINVNHSDAATDVSDKDGLSAEEQSCSDAIDEDLHSCSLTQMDTAASSYSISSSSMGFGTTDSMLETSEDTDPINDITGIDLKVKIRRFTEETSSLREELAQAEEKILTLEGNLKSSLKSLEKLNKKYTQLRTENEEQREMFSEAEKREQLTKEELRKLRKAYINLEKKVKEYEAEKEHVASLKAKIDKLKKENAENKRKLSELQSMYSEKVTEYECLLEENIHLKNDNFEMEKSFERNLEDQNVKIKELQDLNADLQSKMNKNNSSGFSLTPPPYSQGNIHSTPYNNKMQHQDSLYSELKASGFSSDGAKVQSLQEEISFYNEEIATISQQVDEALQEIAALKHEICVPNLQLVETDDIHTLKHKITTLINVAKSYTSTRSQSKLAMREAPCEKPDILPETKKSGCLANDRLFGSPESREHDLIGSVTSSSMPSLSVNGVCPRTDRSTSPIVELASVEESPEAPRQSEEEIIVPIVEALNRIIEIKGTDDEDESETIRRLTRNPKQKSIFTVGKTTDWHNLLADAKKSYAVAVPKAKEDLQPKDNELAKGDGPHCDVIKTKSLDQPKPITDVTTDMKTLKSEFKEYNFPKEDPNIEKLDMKYVTIRPSEKTYVVNQVVSSTADKSNVESPKFGDSVKLFENSYQETPMIQLKNVPRRKLSVYDRSFDIESVQSPNSLEKPSNDKRRSVSTPDVQETDFSTLRTTTFETPLRMDKLLYTYRCANNSDSSISPSPKKPVSTEEFDDSSIVEPPKPIRKAVILAPTKLKLPDSTVDQIPEVKKDKSAPTAAPLRKLSFEQTFGNEDIQQSRILSSSSNLKEQKNDEQKNTITFTVDSKNAGGTVASTMLSDTTTIDMDCSSGSGNGFLLLQRNDKTYTKVPKRAGVEEAEKRLAGATGAPNKTATVAATPVAAAAAAVATASNAGDSGVSVPAVGRAMSSGEDSSAESECNAGTTAKTTVAQSAEPAEVCALKTDNHCLEAKSAPSNDNDPPTENKVQTPPMVNEEKESSCQKVTANNSSQEASKEDESPKAFPSWTDEKLQESDIASFPDVDSEINENLSEEELKKKYTAFSVGLSTDRMTLSRRIILSRRHRDQAEKNFTNEVSKMHQDIKELAPLCVDSESVERVERVKQQLEMVARCTHRVSCDAETLGAVHQERRVSRAVLLADKYLQTLRHKCEKLAAELAETKKILAENNIVLEENLSEMGDDVPRMARRRASIATISRPLLGSNQDISKELPRQRNSVSGRVPGLRRPSLCFESPKWEAEKLDRADSSSSIAELRDIFEQAESRRHSREENNNLIRASINNLSALASDHTEEIDVWSNTREDTVPEIVHDEENFNETHDHGHPVVCWIANRYATWKSMIWIIFIAFLLGFFMNRVVSSGRRNGPPMTWWSFEELFNEYTEVESNKNPFPKPI